MHLLYHYTIWIHNPPPSGVSPFQTTITGEANLRFPLVVCARYGARLSKSAPSSFAKHGIWELNWIAQCLWYGDAWMRISQPSATAREYIDLHFEFLLSAKNSKQVNLWRLKWELLRDDDDDVASRAKAGSAKSNDTSRGVGICCCCFLSLASEKLIRIPSTTASRKGNLSCCFFIYALRFAWFVYRCGCVHVREQRPFKFRVVKYSRFVFALLVVIQKAKR